MNRIIFFIIIIATIHGQTFKCGTVDPPDSLVDNLPWYGNNQFLYDFLDSIGATGTIGTKILGNGNTGIPDAVYFVPVETVVSILSNYEIKTVKL